eukprot:1714915-Amphidinium_carterae.2
MSIHLCICASGCCGQALWQTMPATVWLKLECKSARSWLGLASLRLVQLVWIMASSSSDGNGGLFPSCASRAGIQHPMSEEDVMTSVIGSLPVVQDAVRSMSTHVEPLLPTREPEGYKPQYLKIPQGMVHGEISDPATEPQLPNNREHAKSNTTGNQGTKGDWVMNWSVSTAQAGMSYLVSPSKRDNPRAMRSATWQCWKHNVMS